MSGPDKFMEWFFAILIAVTMTCAIGAVLYCFFQMLMLGP